MPHLCGSQPIPPTDASSSGATVRSLEAKVSEYHQRLRALQAAKEQLEAGWEVSRREREATWDERFQLAESNRQALEARCLVLEKRLVLDPLDGAGDGPKYLNE